MVGGDTHIDCNLLATEADGPGACISKPGTPLSSVSSFMNIMRGIADFHCNRSFSLLQVVSLRCVPQGLEHGSATAW